MQLLLLQPPSLPLLPLLVLILAAVSSALAQDTTKTPSLAAPLEADADGHCPLDSYHSCRPWGHPEACCGPETDCAYNEHKRISCCPRGTFCQSPVGQGNTVFIQTSMASHQAWGDSGGSMSFWAAIVAFAYGGSRWRRTRW